MSDLAKQIDFLLTGIPECANGTVTFYAAGSGTLKTVYLDKLAETEAANPYNLDTNGRALLFGNGTYKAVLKDADGITWITLDNLTYAIGDAGPVDADNITTGTLDGDRLPTISTTKKGAVPATGEAIGKYLKDDGTWSVPAGGGDVLASSLVPAWTAVLGGVGFLNNWVNYGSTSAPAGYFKDPVSGRVWLRGAVKSGNAGSSIFTLPVGLRPLYDTPLAVIGHNNTFISLIIYPNGNVFTPATDTAFVSLDGVSFATT